MRPLKLMKKKISYAWSTLPWGGGLVVSAVIAAPSAVVTSVLPAAVLPRVLGQALVISAIRSAAAASAYRIPVVSRGGPLSWVALVVPAFHILPLLAPKRLSPARASTAGAASAAVAAAAAAVPPARQCWLSSRVWQPAAPFPGQYLT
jgi:hypothetical protein